MLHPATSSVLESPSFNGYSSSSLAHIKASVIDEQHEEHAFEFNLKATNRDQQRHKTQVIGKEKSKEDEPVIDVAQQDLKEEADEDSFEFSVLRDNEQLCLSADEIFQSGHIRPIFPLFNTDLIHTATDWTTPRGGGNYGAPATEARVSKSTSTPAIRLTLKKLLMEEAEKRQGDDDLKNLPPETYCIWTPKNGDKRETVRKKRKSGGGSSNRWKIPEIFGWTGGGGGEDANEMRRTRDGKVVAGGEERAAKAESGRRRSYLPDRRDIVGLFHHVNGLTRVIQPF